MSPRDATETEGLVGMLRGVRPSAHGGLARRLGLQLLAVKLGTGDTPEVGRYQVVDKLGQGGMGVVFSARDPLLDRAVAIKVLHIEGGERAAARLAAEARSLAAVADPHVLAVHDVGVDTDSAWVVTELVRGGTLREWVAREPRTWRAVLERLLEAARGLAVAHRGGLVHRDFKPDNVLVGEDGRARVADFGLARPREALAELGVGSPGSSVVEGTASYLAPELLAGQPATAASDQYAFFVSVRELLEHRAPAELTAVIARGMAADPVSRWPSMDAVVRELETALRPAPRLRAPSLDDLGALAQEAPSREAFLEAALDWVQRTVGYDTALFGRADRQGPLGPRIEGFDPKLLELFQAQPALYAQTLMSLELASAASREVVTDSEVLDGAERRRSAFHADLLGSKGTRVMAVGHLSAAGKQLGSLQISRNAPGTRFSDREQALLTAALPLLALGLAAHEAQPTPKPEALLRALLARGLELDDLIERSSLTDDHLTALIDIMSAQPGVPR